MYFDWNEDKNSLLKKERNISFEDILFALKNDKLLEIIQSPSPSHPDQKSFVIELNNYAYIVPYVKDLNVDMIFLKTIYPSRKFTKLFLKGEDKNER
jgi:uncharacterized DUF497 family protein